MPTFRAFYQAPLWPDHRAKQRQIIGDILTKFGGKTAEQVAAKFRNAPLQAVTAHLDALVARGGFTRDEAGVYDAVPDGGE